jgi:ABC-type multidrug transport system ATPase subunit
MTTTMTLTDLVVGHAGRRVASVSNMELTPDRAWIVTGPNGSGKTTLLKTLAGLLPPVAGTVIPAPTAGASGCVFVHSTPVLFRGTVRSNLAITTDARGVESAAQAFGLVDWLDWPVHELSQGIRQRTSIARAIARLPRVLLVDEAEGGLDDHARKSWADFVRSAVEARRMTIVIAAHKPDSLGVATEHIALKGS